MIKGKTLNLFGAPIPEDTIILHYEIFEKYFITEKQSTEIGRASCRERV